MAVMNVNPTRMELTNLKKKLVTARRGHKLLKDKRDELMRQFLALVKENKELRQKVEQAIKNANELMSFACSSMSDEELSVALMSNNCSAEVDVNIKNIMSVDVPEFSLSSKAFDRNDIYSYGFAFTSGALDGAVEAYNSVFSDMIRLAEVEKTCQRLAREIERTRRRVNALEHVMIPQYEETIRYISMKLEETERDNTTRILKIKDMMIESSRKPI